MLTFLEKKSKMTVPGMSIFWKYMKKHFKSNFFLAVVFVLESKGLSFQPDNFLVQLSMRVSCS